MINANFEGCYLMIRMIIHSFLPFDFFKYFCLLINSGTKLNSYHIESSKSCTFHSKILRFGCRFSTLLVTDLFKLINSGLNYVSMLYV